MPDHLADHLEDPAVATGPPALAPPGGVAEKMLRWVRRRGLEAPAAMILEMHRPLMPMAWSVAMLFGGVAAPMFGPDYYEKIEALRDPELLDRMLARLEDGPDGDEELSPQSAQRTQREAE